MSLCPISCLFFLLFLLLYLGSRLQDYWRLNLYTYFVRHLTNLGVVYKQNKYFSKDGFNNTQRGTK